MPDPTPAHWRRVRDAFEAVADLDPAERTGVLATLCVTPDGELDYGLRSEVEALLAADAADSELDRSTADLAADLIDDDESGALTDGDRVGSWRVVREIGRGGMGVVSLVERADGAYDQRAALKRLVGTGPDGDRRFGRERQILAGLDHPGIARLLDGGLGPRETPYLVMEYVEGEPITAFAHRLGLDDRLGLIVKVCDAVDYAHRRLVVHRDLKPSNVLVAEQDDGTRTVKLLDFGIAKLLDPESDADLTAPHARTPMTRAYAAPEQVRGEAVTTSTDVYGLGLLLFECLTGTRPFPTDGGVRQLETAILDRDPPAPSAASRPGAGGIEPRRLRGDLDVIVRTALAKEPEARYASAGALAADLGRWLRGEPISARAPSLGYRARRFLGRHRVPVGVGALALAVALSVAAAAWVRVDREKAVARRALADADAVAETQGALLRVLQPSIRAKEDSLSDEAPPNVAETIDRAVETVEAAQAEAPAVLAGNLVELGTALYQRGEFARADSLFARALALRRPLRRPADPVVRQALVGRGHVARARGDLTAAAVFYREVVQMEREHPELGAEAGPNSSEMFLAISLRDADDRERVFLETLAERRAALADSASVENEIWVAQAHNQLAAHYFYQARHREAYAEFGAAERIVRRHWGDTHPAANTLRQNLSHAAAAMGRYAEAERHARLGLDAARRGGLGAVVEARMQSALGNALYYQDDLEGAVRVLQAADALLAGLGEDGAPGRRDVQSSLASAFVAQGRLGDALPLVESVEAIHRQSGSLDEPLGILAQTRVTAYRFALGRRDGAIERLADLVRDVRQSEARPNTRAAVLGLAGGALWESGDAEAAVPLLREALAAMREAHPDGHLTVLRARFDYGRALAAMGRLEEARPHLEAARGHVRHVGYPSVVADVGAEIDGLLSGR